MTRRFTVPFTVAAMALGAGACGGEDSTQTLPRAEFSTQANAVCAKFEKQIDAIPTPTGGGSDDEQLKRYADYVDKVAPVTSKAHDELSALAPDDEALAKKWDAYLDQVEDGIDDIEESADKARDGDKAGTQAAAKRLSARNPDAEPITGKGACAG